MTTTKPQNATTIDTFSQGYAAINRRPWLLLVPILLNLYLWFGAPLSFGPLLSELAATLQALQAGVPGQAQYNEHLLRLMHADMRLPLAIFNFIPTLTPYVVSGIDTSGTAANLPLIQEVPRLIDRGAADVIQISTLPAAILTFLLVNAIALPLSAAFLTQTAEAVRGDRAPFATRLRRIGHAMAAILGFSGLVAGVVLALGLPFAFFIALLATVNANLAGLAFSILVVIGFWISIYLGFAREAIVVSGVGPLQAIHASFNIVRRNFWGTLLFLALSLIISVGTGLIWYAMATSTAGLFAAIIGSAYIGCGLLAARMAFYRERLRRWQSAVGPGARGQGSRL